MKRFRFYNMAMSAIAFLAIACFASCSDDEDYDCGHIIPDDTLPTLAEMPDSTPAVLLVNSIEPFGKYKLSDGWNKIASFQELAMKMTAHAREVNYNRVDTACMSHPFFAHFSSVNMRGFTFDCAPSLSNVVKFYGYDPNEGKEVYLGDIIPLDILGIKQTNSTVVIADAYETFAVADIKPLSKTVAGAMLDFKVTNTKVSIMSPL